MSKSVAGFALPLVLIMVALLTAMSMGLSSLAAGRVEDIQLRKSLWETERRARNQLEAKAYTLLTGAYAYLDVSAGSQSLKLNGEPVEEDGLQIAVQDGAGLFSLALYDPTRFQALLEKLTEKDRARDIAAELGDWVDDDNRRRFRGLESAGYVSRGLRYLPRNAPVRSVEELLKLPSMTPEIFFGSEGKPGLRDLVLAGGHDYVNIATAPPEVLGPMLGASKTREMQLLSAQRNRDWRAMLELVDLSSWQFNQLSPYVHGTRYVFTFTDSSGAVIRAQMQLTPYDTDGIYKLIEWRAPDYGNG